MPRPRRPTVSGRKSDEDRSRGPRPGARGLRRRGSFRRRGGPRPRRRRRGRRGGRRRGRGRENGEQAENGQRAESNGQAESAAAGFEDERDENEAPAPLELEPVSGSYAEAPAIAVEAEDDAIRAHPYESDLVAEEPRAVAEATAWSPSPKSPSRGTEAVPGSRSRASRLSPSRRLTTTVRSAAAGGTAGLRSSRQHGELQASVVVAGLDPA